jgi:hypothetical protein
VDFEQEAQRQRLAPSTKARLIRQRFGLTPPRYMWWLIRMLDWPEVRAYAPPFVARFRRVLDERHRRRWVDRLAV